MRLVNTALVIGVGLASAACTRQYQQYDMLTLKPGKRVTVETVDGAEIKATVLPATTNATEAEIVLADESGRIVQTQHIARVVDMRRGRGAMHGALIGGLIGVTLGAAIGYATASDQSIVFNSREENAAFAGVGAGLLGAGVGYMIGHVVGSPDVYTFGYSGHARVTPTGPRGSVAGVTLRF